MKTKYPPGVADFHQQVFARLMAHAKLDYDKWPQYNIDAYKLGIMLKRSARTKGGARFDKHEYVLAALLEGGRIQVYCPSTGGIVGLDADCIQWVNLSVPKKPRTTDQLLVLHDYLVERNNRGNNGVFTEILYAALIAEMEKDPELNKQIRSTWERVITELEGATS